ncbi:hypothetical protein G5C51_40920 [Streptomyces sp. A7024]|uniref:Integral membrane protein n=1 Tax=Streptomyces coryli TaxID=1128680 RepID=A0A6G4UDY8_9ACTN|nr:DUF6113 family protein [Streptomyces coryli]NGN70232.1 hypothetical protein [Streptomyces coryli]
MTVPRLLAFAGLLLLGLLTGAAGALLQAASWSWFPGGLLLSLLALGALCYGGVKALDARSAGMVAGAGWLLAVMLLTTTRPEGDFVFGAGLGSYAYLLGGVIVAFTTVIRTTTSHPPGAGQGVPRLAK